MCVCVCVCELRKKMQEPDEIPYGLAKGKQNYCDRCGREI